MQPSTQVFAASERAAERPTTSLLVLALGLLGITWAMRIMPAWIHPRGLLTGIVIVVLGLLLLVADASVSSAKLIFSFWLPTAALGGPGLWYIVASAFGRTKP
jgi:hypothetical protein